MSLQDGTWEEWGSIRLGILVGQDVRELSEAKEDWTGTWGQEPEAWG